MEEMIRLEEMTGILDGEDKSKEDIENQYAVEDMEDELFKAVQENREQDACTLIEQGAKLNKKYRSNKTILMIAAENGSSEIVDSLLSNDVEIDVQDEDGWTPLMIAAHGGHKNIVDALIKKEADVNVESEKDGETALTSTRQELLIINFVQTRCGDALSLKTRFLKDEHIRTSISSGESTNTQNDLDLAAIIERACPEQTFTTKEKEMMAKFRQVPESEYKTIREKLLINGGYDVRSTRNSDTKYVLRCTLLVNTLQRLWPTYWGAFECTDIDVYQFSSLT